MKRESEEEYLGAIYRLRESAAQPLPLSRLSTHFGFSPVSIHEMVQKLVSQGCVDYHPYRGVTLTAKGDEVAQGLLRKHRLWERFLTDILDIPWDEAHEIAGRLEHASTKLVTERLSTFLGDPESCPHGETIPPAKHTYEDLCLSKVPLGSTVKITRISPETQGLLQRIQDFALLPGYFVHILEHNEKYTQVARDNRIINVTKRDAQRIWAEVM